MVGQKRRRQSSTSQNVAQDSDASDASDGSDGSDRGDFEVVSADSGIDFSSVLAGTQNYVDNEDDDIEELIRVQKSKRLVKDSTEIIKMTLRGQGKRGTGTTGGGSFQSMGLHPSLFRGLIVRGYRIPTPIQRASIPSLLATPPRDLVGMARTGSGKTLAYMVPLIQRLGGRHATTFGARALILVPARELALQVLRVGKDLARGWSDSGGDHAGDIQVDAQAESKNSHALRWGLIVGGENLDEQFEVITNNPDVIIATPGRLLHLTVEMNLDLKSIQYAVFDEADRLFEMGFETALQEILHRLPSARQTVLFSATLPKSLVEFAKAGLQNPKLVRLDAESKLSNDLRMAFFSVKQAEKDACLLALLRDVIKVPLRDASAYAELGDDEGVSSRRVKGKRKEFFHQMAPHQTLVFVATKHHVEYLLALLTGAGYSVSHIYGALDQGARTQQMSQFRRGRTSILVVTDVAARGIDIPVLEHVVNYDFPHGARVFVHRVGRTARAGRKGWAWSFVTHNDLPRLLDLQLFLGRPLMSRKQLETSSSSSLVGITEATFVENLILGTFDRTTLDNEMEAVSKLDVANSSLPSLREVMYRGHGMYERSMGKASQASYTRAKEMAKEAEKGPSWGLTGGSDEADNFHPVFRLFGITSFGPSTSKAGASNNDAARNALLRAVDTFRPLETVFEIGGKGKAGTAQLMKDRRKTLAKVNKKALPNAQLPFVLADDPAEILVSINKPLDTEMADERAIQDAFQLRSKEVHKKDYRDPEFFMSHYRKDAAADKGYSLKDGSSFAQQAASATFDLTTDEALTGRQRRSNQLTWDKKKKNWVKGREGADNVKLVKTESGARLPASYVSGRFEEWKSKTKMSLPRVGEAELNRPSAGSGDGSRRFRFHSTTPGKTLDPQSIGYERKIQQLKRRTFEADGADNAEPPRMISSNGPPLSNRRKGRSKSSLGPRFGGAHAGKVKNELKSVDQIRRTRQLTAHKKAKNARPGKGRKR